MTVLTKARSAGNPQPDHSALAHKGLAAFFRIAERWQLTARQQQIVLGQPARSTFFKWKSGQPGVIGKDTLERLSYIVGIYKALQILIPRADLADAWITHPNDAPLFNGQPPIAMLTEGSVASLYRMRAYLDAQRGGWGVTPVTHVRWQTSYRIIPTRFPATPLFAGVAAPEDWEALDSLADLTSPRAAQTQDRYGLFSKDELARGEGADLVMAAFTYLNSEGSRFSDGSYGVYYAGRKLETAIHETVHHRRKFWLASRLPSLRFPMKVLEARIDGKLHDLRGKLPDKQILDPESYAASKAFALKLKALQKSAGVVFPSVRDAGGECVGAFIPRVVSQCKRTQLLDYIWDGVGEVTVVKMDLIKVLKGGAS